MRDTASLRLLEDGFVAVLQCRDSYGEIFGDKWGNVAKIADKRLIARPGLTEAEYEAIMSDKGTFWDDAEMIYSGWREKCIAS